jgi:O-antigen/teichoic acid export membrane protein
MAVAFTVAIMAVGMATGPAIQAKGRIWLGLLFNVTWGVLTLLFVWLTAQRGGALSIAYGIGLSYLATTVWAFLYLRKELPHGMLNRVFEAIVVSAALLAIASLLTATQRILLVVPAVFLVSWITLTRLSAKHVRDALWHRISDVIRRDPLAI